MTWFNGNRMRMILVGFVSVIVLSRGGNAKADFTFGEPTNLGPNVNSSAGDVFPEISADGLTLYFSSDRPEGYGDHDLWVTTRASTNDPWEEALNMGPTINSPEDDFGPSISTDGLALFFNSDCQGGFGENDLWVTTRATLNDDWGSPVNLGPVVNGPANDFRPFISSDGLSLYFSSERAGGQGNQDLYVTTRPTKNHIWSTPMNLGPTINSSDIDFYPSITYDGLVLTFSSSQPSTYGNHCNLWLTRRLTTSHPWSTPVDIGPFINTDDVIHMDISSDGTFVLLTCFKRPGGYGWQDIWEAPIIPIVDFNGDGYVNSIDTCIMVDHWGTNEPVCDIGPMPWGDGIVDVQDLIILTEYLVDEVPPVE